MRRYKVAQNWDVGNYLGRLTRYQTASGGTRMGYSVPYGVHDEDCLRNSVPGACFQSSRAAQKPPILQEYTLGFFLGGIGL